MAALAQRGETYRTLQAAEIVKTAERLEQRISERFPVSGLLRVAGELYQVACEAQVRAIHIRRPYIGLRLVIGLLVLALGAMMIAGIAHLRVDHVALKELASPEHFFTFLESALGTTVFVGAAVAFLFSLEIRWKRQRAMSALRELRALAHIVDMHQLTKDPESTLHRGPTTKSSPRRTLTPFELGRYLDYCSEMLSLISKIGAIYVQDLPDQVAVQAVDQLAELTNSLSRSIWQKIMILDEQLKESPPHAPAGSTASLDAPPTSEPDAAGQTSPPASVTPSA